MGMGMVAGTGAAPRGMMASDTTALAIAPAWTQSRFRLDPRALPQTLKVPTGIASGTGEAAFLIRRDEISACRHLPCGIPMTLRFPARAFKAVAARILPGAADTDDSVTVTLELMHHDPHLSVPLMASDELTDIAADWMAWARLFGLPMAVIHPDGSLSDVDRVLGALRIHAAKARRRRVSRLSRRPRFLQRRRLGTGAGPVLMGREICAWD